MLAERTQAEQARLSGFLAKPVSPGMLLEAITRACDALAPTHQHALEHSQRRLAQMRILVVEDNLLNQQVAEELLGREGALVSLAANGQQGVDAVAAASPPFDAVLMDLQMPVLDGFAATHIIREELGQKALPIIAMSANVMAEDVTQCLAAGMNDHVGKPFELGSLVALLRHHVGWTNLSAAEHTALTSVMSSAGVELLGADQSGQIDLAQALEWVDGDTTLYRAFAEGFVRDIADNADQLAQHLGRGEQKDAMRILHTLKGLSRTVGANQLADFAARHEAELKGIPLDPQTLDALVQETRDRIAVVSDEIRQILGKIDAGLAPR
jgi:CheY-like chemotaxis protein/HPt (histidine-containing phosphotransfer) domain-containing protein